MPNREQYIIDEIINVKADVVCLQEVWDKAQARLIADNCTDTSDVQRFLIGDCSLTNVEAAPCRYDLALNFRENPRFMNNTIELNARFDRILLRNTYPYEFPMLKECSVFGKRIYTDINLSASNHYGVVMEMDY